MFKVLGSQEVKLRKGAFGLMEKSISCGQFRETYI